MINIRASFGLTRRPSRSAGAKRVFSRLWLASFGTAKCTGTWPAAWGRWVSSGPRSTSGSERQYNLGKDRLWKNGHAPKICKYWDELDLCTGCGPTATVRADVRGGCSSYHSLGMMDNSVSEKSEGKMDRGRRRLETPHENLVGKCSLPRVPSKWSIPLFAIQVRPSSGFKCIYADTNILPLPQSKRKKSTTSALMRDKMMEKFLQQSMDTEEVLQI